MMSFCDIYFCDFRRLCFYLTVSWFGRPCIVMEISDSYLRKQDESVDYNPYILCVLCDCKLLLCSGVHANKCKLNVL